MQLNGIVRKRGFTLIELLTVIAIISLLISLLVPAVNTARTQAKNLSVRNLVETLGKGCEMFNQEFGAYPQSSGGNPFEASAYTTNPPSPPLSGAQWLVLDLAGADLKGYVKQDKDHFYDSQPPPPAPPDGINQRDWLDWYSLTPSRDDFRRSAFINLDGKIAKSPDRYHDDTGVTLTPGLTAGTQGADNLPNNKLPFVVDTFGYPVLYYAANPQAKLPFTDVDTSRPGVYTQWDNTPFTGSENGSIAGLDLGGGTAHPMYNIGWSVTAGINARPQDRSFAEAVYDRGLFEQQTNTAGEGKVWPYRPDTFLIISAGKDGLYGSSDDVTNFERR